MTDIILSKKTERLAEQRLQAPRCDTLLAMPTAVGGDETLRAPGRGSPTRSSTNERLGSRTAHGNGTAFSAVAPSERPVLPSIDPIFGSGIPPGPNSHPTFRSLIRFRLLWAQAALPNTVWLICYIPPVKSLPRLYDSQMHNCRFGRLIAARCLRDGFANVGLQVSARCLV